MSLFLKILIIFVVYLIIRFIINFSKFNRMSNYYEKYKDYFNNKVSNVEFDKKQIIELFKDSDVEDFYIGHVEPMGYGQLATTSIKGFENMFLHSERVYVGIESKFIESIGVFRHRMYQTFNPIFWFDFIFKLPQYLLKDLGVLPEKLIVKIITVMYWVVCLLLGLNSLDILKLFTK
jgi:hypothetical protein